MINIPVNQIQKFDEIDSIDQAAELLNHSLENGETQIPIETEFWGHCSNLQAWVENNYDSRLLHSNLAFPLLRELYELGDLQAKKSFKEEIARRLTTNYEPVIIFLFEEGYLDYLSQDEIESLTEDLDFNVISKVFEYPSFLMNNDIVIYKIQDLTHFFIDEAFDYNLKFDIKNKIEIITKELIATCRNIYGNSFVSHTISELSENIKKIFLHATFFHIGHRHRKHPHKLFIDLLISLREIFKEVLIEFIVYESTIIDVHSFLCLCEFNIKEITKLEGLEELVDLCDLDLSYNKIREIKGLEKLVNLEELNLSNNKILEIKGLKTLNNLRILDLSNNRISILPESILELPVLEEIYLINCPLEGIPELVSDNLFVFTSKNIDKFQKETNKHAFWGDMATYAFKKWYKLETIKRKYNYTKEDIERFKNDIGKRWIYDSTPTKAFKNWLHENT